MMSTNHYQDLNGEVAGHGILYHRRSCIACCIMRAGETDGGGEATARVVGFTIGIALRLR